MSTRDQHEFEQKHPHPGTDPIARLRHTLDVYGADVNDDDFAIRATSGMYPDGGVTGLTWGDLRAIAVALQIGA
jgi:hypothetical protein